MTSYSVTLPVYYTVERKTKPSSTHLIGANWLRNVHFHVKNKVKVFLADIVADTLKDETIPLKGTYRVTYTYFYKNKGSDLMNVVSACSKAFLDAMQDANLIHNDNVQHCIEEVAIVGGLDKVNPRIEILIEEISNGNE